MIGGSYRRGKWWCNDIDLLIPVKSDEQADGVRANILKLGWELIRGAHEFAFSDQYHMMVGDKVLVLDVFLVPPGSMGNAILFTTGSKGFNDNIRIKLISKGLSWRDPRYFTYIRDEKLISFDSEKEAMLFLDMKYVKPKNRV
jgi:DNA polymerase/3'-5' exonuclease PolX